MNFGSIKCIEMKLWYSLGIYLDFFILLYWSNITAISIVLLLTLAWWIEKLSCSLAFKVFLKKPSHCSARVCFALNRPAQTPGIYNHGHMKSGIVLFSRNILLLAIFLSFPPVACDSTLMKLLRVNIRDRRLFCTAMMTQAVRLTSGG